MNNDANPFAACEPNTTAGQEDLGGDFDLAGAAARVARTASVFGGSDQGAANTAVSTTMAKAWSRSSRAHV